MNRNIRKPNIGSWEYLKTNDQVAGQQMVQPVTNRF